MRPSDISLLRCPDCRGGVRQAVEGLACEACGEVWRLVDGMPRMYREDWVRGPDKLMRHFYDNLPRLHDPAVKYLLPLMQMGGSEETLRGGYLPRLELDQLRGPARILEVGVGGGANIPLILSQLSGLDLEYWGLDLSTGMLAHCQRRLGRMGARSAAVRLLQGDAHTLPFADGTFDRVFHVGGIGGYRDPAQGLAEMARVARAGTPIVVVDEQLDPAMSHNLWHKLTFRALTFYDKDPHCPAELLPPGAYDVCEEHVSRFYYALTFRCGSAVA